jgi:hypothetical protein
MVRVCAKTPKIGHFPTNSLNQLGHFGVLVFWVSRGSVVGTDVDAIVRHAEVPKRV